MGEKWRKRGGRKSRDFREEFVSLNKNPQVEKEYGSDEFGAGAYGGEQNRVAEGVEYETGKSPNNPNSDIPLSEKRGID